MKSEIFDQLQYLYHVTGFNDHQIHCVIKFENKINAEVMEKAVKGLVKQIPILSMSYVNQEGKSYWEEKKLWSNIDLFQTVDNEQDFYKFTCSKTMEDMGPQIKVCLLKADKDAISIILNHMVTDGAGAKQCVYLLSDLYSKIMIQPDYIPQKCLDGDRSFHKVLSGIKFKDRMKILILKSKDNNQNSNYTYPMSKDNKIAPFLLTLEIPSDRFDNIQKYCKKHNATMNDVLLTTYFRVLSQVLNCKGKKLSIPIMIDMRRYLKDENLTSLGNLSSTVIVSIVVNPGENFNQSLKKVRSEMKIKKEDSLGISTFLKLNTLYKILGYKLSYQILKKKLKNPTICMTNIGVLDSNQLKFEGSLIENAYIFGSIKYRPHFQLAVSSFNNIMTLCVNLYGSDEDKYNFQKFLDLIEKELWNVSEQY